MIEKLEALLASGADSAQLRFGLASAYLADGNAEVARRHAKIAIELDADYSAAWRLLGRAESALGLIDDARATYKNGITIAEKRGDQQLVKEMKVFLKRLDRQD